MVQNGIASLFYLWSLKLMISVILVILLLFSILLVQLYSADSFVTVNSVDLSGTVNSVELYLSPFLISIELVLFSDT